ncbi:pol, partial [Mucuna pruriens]
MGPLVSNGYSYILLVVDYVSRWVEAIAIKTNDAKVMVDFLKSNIFYRFGVPKALISDQGSHFCNRAIMGWCTELPQHITPRQTTKLKYSIGKSRKFCKANPNRKDWSRFLEDALWAHKTAYQTPLGMFPYWIVFSKAYHLLVEIEHQAYWAVKQCNLAYDQASKERKLQLQELEELCLEAYENSRIYKQKVDKSYFIHLTRA